MNRYLLPKFQNGNDPEDRYGTVGDYYPVGAYDNYYNPRTDQPSAIEQIKDYLFGMRPSSSYEGIMNGLNYLASILDFSKNAGTIQKGPNRGRLKLSKKSTTSYPNIFKTPNVKSKRRYYPKNLQDVYGRY